MDIAQKFSSKDADEEKLKRTVEDAEARLQSLRERFDELRRDSEGTCFDLEAGNKTRSTFLEAEEHEMRLCRLLKEHEQGQQELEEATLQVEHMRRWANRVGKSLSIFEECASVEKPQDLEVFFKHMSRAVEKFVSHIVQHISLGKAQRRNMAQATSKEYHEARRLLTDQDFLKLNCRVPPSLDAANRPWSRGQGGVDEDSQEALQQERDKCKREARARTMGATRKHKGRIGRGSQ